MYASLATDASAGEFLYKSEINFWFISLTYVCRASKLRIILVTSLDTVINSDFKPKNRVCNISLTDIQICSELSFTLIMLLP